MHEGQKKTLGQAIDAIVDALISLDEATRATAIRAACDHLAIAQLASAGGAAQDVATPKEDAREATVAAVPVAVALDVRSLKDQKRPKTAAEMACVVAYYLESVAPAGERKKDVTSEDMQKYFKQAGFPLPKRPQQLLLNARASGYFDSAGHGKYRLNPVGHNLVAHGLPRSTAK